MLKVFSYSSVFIGIAAFSLSLFYGHMLDSIILPRSLMIGLATVAAYNFTQLAPLRIRRPINERGAWIKRNSTALWRLCFLCLGLSGALSYYLSLYDWINYLHLFVLCLLYENSFGNRPARKVPFLKPFYISYIWTMAIAAPGIYDTHSLALSLEDLGLLLECFLFMLSLCILFDLRDIEEDKALGFATLANRLRPLQVKSLALALMALSLAYLWAFQQLNFISLSAYFLGYTFLVWRTNQRSSEYAFLYLLDGMILIKFFLL